MLCPGQLALGLPSVCDEATTLPVCPGNETAPGFALSWLMIQQDRDELVQRLLRESATQARTLADLLDLLSLNADARRPVARLLGELEARDGLE